MALTDSRGGILDVLDKTVDVYTGKPEQLKQKTKNQGVTPDLINALALQKVTADRDAAAREMALSMDQNPATILQQLEQKATGQATQSIAEQVGIAGQQKKQKQDKAIKSLATKLQQGKGNTGIMGIAPNPQKRVMPQTAQTQPTRPPMAPNMGNIRAGVAQVPRPPMNRVMNSGGIVGFNRGGGIDRFLKNKAIKKFREGGRVYPEDITDKEVQDYRMQNYTYDIISKTYKPVPKPVGLAVAGQNQTRSSGNMPTTTQEIKQFLANRKTQSALIPIQRNIRRVPVFTDDGQYDAAATDKAYNDKVNAEMLKLFPAKTDDKKDTPKIPTTTAGIPIPGVDLDYVANRPIDISQSDVPPPPDPTQELIDSVAADKQSMLDENESLKKLQDLNLAPTQSTITGDDITKMRDANIKAIEDREKKDDAKVTAVRDDTADFFGRDAKKTAYEADLKALKGTYEDELKDPRLSGSEYRAGLQGLYTGAYGLPGGGFADYYDRDVRRQYGLKREGIQKGSDMRQAFDTADIRIGESSVSAGNVKRQALTQTGADIARLRADASEQQITAAENVAKRVNAGLKNELDKLITLTTTESDAITTAKNLRAEVAKLTIDQANKELENLQNVKEKAVDLAIKEVKNLIDVRGKTVIGLDDNFAGNVMGTAEYAEAVRLATAKNLETFLLSESELRQHIANLRKNNPVSIDNPKDLE